MSPSPPSSRAKAPPRQASQALLPAPRTSRRSSTPPRKSARNCDDRSVTQCDTIERLKSQLVELEETRKAKGNAIAEKGLLPALSLTSLVEHAAADSARLRAASSSAYAFSCLEWGRSGIRVIHRPVTGEDVRAATKRVGAARRGQCGWEGTGGSRSTLQSH